MEAFALRPERIETPCAVVGAALQHHATVVFHASSLAPPAQGTLVVVWQQPSPHSPAAHPSTGMAVPRRATQMTSKVVSRRAKIIRSEIRIRRLWVPVKVRSRSASRCCACFMKRKRDFNDERRMPFSGRAGSRSRPRADTRGNRTQRNAKVNWHRGNASFGWFAQ